MASSVCNGDEADRVRPNVKSRGLERAESNGGTVEGLRMIVGITARADWRGPYVLNGRSMVAGTSKARWKLSRADPRRSCWRRTATAR